MVSSQRKITLQLRLQHCPRLVVQFAKPGFEVFGRAFVEPRHRVFRRGLHDLAIGTDFAFEGTLRLLLQKNLSIGRNADTGRFPHAFVESCIGSAADQDGFVERGRKNDVALLVFLKRRQARFVSSAHVLFGNRIRGRVQNATGDFDGLQASADIALAWPNHAELLDVDVGRIANRTAHRGPPNVRP